MSEQHKRSKKSSLISPLFSIAPSPSNKLLSPNFLTHIMRPLHRRTQSDFPNPYLDHRELKSLKASTKILTRQSSPRDQKITSSHSKKAKNVAVTKTKLQTKPKKIVRNTKPITDFNEKLTELQGEPVFKSPKLFPNQFFSDVYDINGNHDRIFDVEDSIEIYQEVRGDKKASGPCVIFNVSNFEKAYNNQNRAPKAPDNSIEETRGETPDNSKKKLSVESELIYKLNKMLHTQDAEYPSDQTTSESGAKSRN